MKPTAVTEFPQLDGLLWQPKADGHRVAAFLGTDGVQLQSPRKNLVTTRFPELVEVLSQLPAGLVLDGEVVGWCTVDGEPRLDFASLARTPAHRRQLGVSVQFLAFDLLADIGGKDWRPRPLAERWPRLLAVLDNAPPAVAAIISTEDREEASEWERRLLPRGFEGTVAKRLSRSYRQAPDSWWKRRAVDTVDGTIIEGVGSASMRVELDDGGEGVTRPLTPAQIRELAEVLADRPAGAGRLRGEFQVGVGRHGQIAFVRLRSDE